MDFGSWKCRRLNLCQWSLFNAYFEAQVIYFCGTQIFVGVRGQLLMMFNFWCIIPTISALFVWTLIFFLYFHAFWFYVGGLYIYWCPHAMFWWILDFGMCWRSNVSWCLVFYVYLSPHAIFMRILVFRGVKDQTSLDVDFFMHILKPGC